MKKSHKQYVVVTRRRSLLDKLHDFNDRMKQSNEAFQAISDHTMKTAGQEPYITPREHLKLVLAPFKKNRI